jgi:hypothetical protein
LRAALAQEDFPMAQRDSRNPRSDRSPAGKNPQRRRDNANQGTEGGRQRPAEPERGGIAPRPDAELPEVDRRSPERQLPHPEKGGRGDAGDGDLKPGEPEIGEREPRDSNDAQDRVRRDVPVSDRS